VRLVSHRIWHIALAQLEGARPHGIKER
jgi:hypothetical protein